MGNFNRDNKNAPQRGPFGSGRGFGGGRSFGGGGRNMRRSQMHKATCSQCGNECEIPFKPTGDRPVFCSTCFSAQGGGNAGRPDRKSFDRPHFNDRKPSSNDKQMHKAVCAKCGDTCEVPFKPMEGKPVYCNQCFEKGGKNTIQFKEQFDAVSEKLDKIMKALKITVSAKTADDEREKKAKANKKLTAKTKVAAKTIVTKKKK